MDCEYETKIYARFFSPGTLADEITDVEVKEFNVREAVKKSKSITERYGAKPYGFTFVTKTPILGGMHEEAVPGTFFLGGKLLTAEEILAGTDPKEQILRN